MPAAEVQARQVLFRVHAHDARHHVVQAREQVAVDAALRRSRVMRVGHRRADLDLLDAVAYLRARGLLKAVDEAVCHFFLYLEVVLLVRDIAEEVGAILMCDVAHYAGLIVAGEYPSPFPFADIVTSTTHKTLRGPRGGLILTNDEEMAKKVNKAVFPGVQGGPLMHIIAGKAVAFAEALTDDFKKYAHQMIVNAHSLAEALINTGINILTNGTDSHMVIIDLRNLNVNGREVEIALDEIGITCNKNAIPNDPLPPSLTSGIRLGTPAGTTRWMDEQDFKLVGEIIADMIFALNEKKLDDTIKLNLKKKVQSITGKLASIPVIK